MKIALIGYGKMGRAIDEAATDAGHEVIMKITSANTEELTGDKLSLCDVAIEFTNPASAPANIKACIDAGIPVISGSTGWLERFEEVKKYCEDKNGTFLYASNFSIGVNIFFEINKRLATLMSSQKEYDVSIKEIHHTQKKDAPSGTAISLAQQILEERNDKTGWSLSDKPQAHEIGITAQRTDPAPGTHHVKYSSAIDDLEIIHTAHSRKGFAAGALIAANFVAGKKGIFSMSDVLKEMH